MGLDILLYPYLVRVNSKGFVETAGIGQSNQSVSHLVTNGSWYCLTDRSGEIPDIDHIYPCRKPQRQVSLRQGPIVIFDSHHLLFSTNSL